MSFNQIILEGTDMIGKTTILSSLNELLPNMVFDRDRNFSLCIGLNNVDPAIHNIVAESPESLYIILYTHNNSTLEQRLEDRKMNDPSKISPYDLDAIQYNISYKKAACLLSASTNVVSICIDDKTPFNIISEIVQTFLSKNLKSLPSISLEGESKIYRRLEGTNLALVSLKPTLYSHTFNRYGEVPGTDILRENFWSLFGTRINQQYSIEKINNRDPLHTFPSSYITSVMLNGLKYTVVRFWDKISPLEVVWKNYLVGTMKHNLHHSDYRKTKYGAIINYEDKFPTSIIRFDWRNDLPGKDECIPDDYADFYIEVKKAKSTARYATKIIADMLEEKGYELVDLCYFMTYDGMQVCGEISPDGMRIRKHGSSYDKDLWRSGKDKTELCSIWQQLYDDIK